MRKLYLVLSLFVGFTLTAYSQFQLNTVPPLNGGNGNAGVTFGIRSVQTVILDSIYCTFNNTGSTDIWYTSTDTVGPPNISAANGWTQIGTATISSGANGAGSITAVPLGIGITLIPGTNYRFYVNGSLGAGVAYTTGTAGAAAPFTDGIVTIETGNLIGYGGAMPNPNFHPRQFNGGVKYSILGGTNDAAVLSIDSPAVYCAGAQSVYATVANFGANQIDSVTVNWEVNGVAQPSIKYIGLLDTLNGAGSHTAQIMLGSYTFPSGLNDLKVYTSDPNGVADTSNFNDTVSVKTGPSLSGNFTVNPSMVTGGTNFNSLLDMNTALNTFGICGPVTVTVSNFLYDNQYINLSGVPGLSSVNTLTIDGGDSSATFVRNNANQFAAMTFDNVEYVTVRNISFESTDQTGGVAALFNNANHNTLSNCQLIVDASVTTSLVSNTVMSSSNSSLSSGAVANYNTISNNKMVGGYYGFYMYGSTSQLLVNNKIMNNELDSVYYYGVYSYYNDSLEFIGNDIDQTQRNNLNGDGAYIYYSNNVVFEGNNILAEDYGAYFYNFNTYAPINRRYRIVNNMVSSNTDYGVYMYYVDSVDIWHNTFQALGTTSPALQIGGSATNGASGYDVRNNIFSSATTEALETITVTDTIFIKLDNNVYYTTGANLINIAGTQYPSLTAYQSAQPLFNIASLEGDPQFASATDLHIVGAFVNDNGDNSTGVMTDIDGDMRPIAGATTVDIGADEFDPPTCPPPANTYADNITDASAIIHWMSSTLGNTVEIEFMPCGTAQGSGTVYSSAVDSLNIGGLTPATCYEFYIREACGRGDTSQWIGPFSFNTSIAGPRGVSCITGNSSVIFTEEFDVIGNWTGDVNTGTTAADWNFGHTGQTGSTNTGPSGAHSGNGYVYVETSGSNNTVGAMVSPAIDLTQVSDSAELSFWMHAYGATMGTLTVGIGTSATGPFTPAFTWSGELQTALNDPFQQVGIRLDNYVGQIIYVEFSFLTGSSFTSDIAIDLMEVSGCVSCPMPTNLTATNITLNTADLNWIEAGSATNWQVSVGAAGGTPTSGTLTTTSTKPVSLTGLTASTQYEFYVRSICGPGDTSGWVGPLQFGTANGIPWSEDFETFPAGNFQNPWPNDWTSTTTTDPNWESEDANNGNNENSTATGPLWDHTNFGGPTNGMYIYMETSGGTVGDTADFVSPAIFVGANPVIELKYWYFNHGANIDRMEVLVDTNGVENLITTYTGQQQANQTDPWLQGAHTLAGYQGKSIRIIFRGFNVACCSGDIAIDDVSLTVPSPVDGGVSDILRPLTGCGLGATDSVEVEVTNFGTQSISNFSVSYIFNGGAAVTETYTGTLAPGATGTHVFNSTVNLSATGTYSISAYTTIGSDGNVSNDTSSAVIDAIPLVGSLPYTEGFENGAGGWATNGANSSWALGMPSASYINAAGQGTQAWVTNLTGSYNNNEMSYLESPCFDMSMETNDPVVTFLHIFETEDGFDEGWMELSTDGGNTWNKVINLGQATNWYNDIANQWWEDMNVSGATVWDTASNVLTGAAGSSDVKIRFAMSSDGSVIREGFGVDTISIDRIVGIQEELANSSNFTVYPNPSNGSFRLIMNNKQDADYTLKLRDAQGKLIIEEQLNVNGNFVKDYNFEDLSRGVYFLSVQSDEESIVKKLIIQ